MKDKENLQIKLGWKWIPHVVKNNLVEQLYFFPAIRSTVSIDSFLPSIIICWKNIVKLTAFFFTTSFKPHMFFLRSRPLVKQLYSNFLRIRDSHRVTRHYFTYFLTKAQKAKTDIIYSLFISSKNVDFPRKAAAIIDLWLVWMSRPINVLLYSFSAVSGLKFSFINFYWSFRLK